MGDLARVKCLRLAATQYGVLHREQAMEREMSRHQLGWLLETGLWEVQYPSVYRVEGTPRSWRQRLKALCLWAQREFAISHASAAALHGLARFREGPLEISVTRHLKHPRNAVVHVVKDLPWKDIMPMQGLRVTKPVRTLLDLAKIEDEATIRATFDELLRRNLVTLDRLDAVLSGKDAHPGLRFLRQLLRDYDGGELPTESELEARVYDLLDAASYRRPIKQQALAVGGKRIRIDFIFPGTRIVLEALGYRWHGRKDIWDRDIARMNALTARGFSPLQWTWDAMTQTPAALLDDLGLLLRGVSVAHAKSP